MLTFSDYSGVNALNVLPKTATFHEICQVLSQKGVHRVVTVEPTTMKLVRFVTQGDIVRYLKNHTEKFGDHLHKTVSEMDLGSCPCVCIEESKTTLDAFKMMLALKVIALEMFLTLFRSVGWLSQMVGNV